jgi:cellobiose phosphorylase
MSHHEEMVGAMIVKNPLGLTFTFSDAFALQSIAVDPIQLSLTTPSVSSRPCANLYLRRRDAERAYTPLLGPESPSRYELSAGRLVARGSWAGLKYECLLVPAEAQLSWQWQVVVESQAGQRVELDLIYVQDVGLKASSPNPANEYYVSQYLERRVFDHAQHGKVVCCRQNMRESVGHPWLMVACTPRAIAASTDGLQFYGRTFRATGKPEALTADELGGELSGESSIVALQQAPFALRPGESRTSSFVVTYLPDHPEASSEADLQRLTTIASASAVVSAPAAPGALAEPLQSRLQGAPLLPAEDLTLGELDALFGSERRHVEQTNGTLLSFFTNGPRHVVLRQKELQVDRPHGHIMQAHVGYAPDEHIMSTTAFACGVFNSHLTQGNTNFTTLLSVCSNPTTPALEGQRALVEVDGQEYLLGVPSAFEMGLSHCRWLYKLGATLLEVCTWTSPHESRVNFTLKVLRGAPVRLLLTHQLDELNRWTVTAGAEQGLLAKPHEGSMLAAQFPRAQYRLIVSGPEDAYRVHGGEALLLEREARARDFVVLEVRATSAFCLSIVGEVPGATSAAQLLDPDAQRRVDCEQAAEIARELSRELTLSDHKEVGSIREILPWYSANALIHYLTPYGLEQFSGAAWGTRDVCQGPIDLLLCQEKYEEAKQVLRVVFSHQNADGGWPQWWMFDSYHGIRADSAHGDVIYWCILALCSYIKASGDFGFLAERLPYYQTSADTHEVGPASEPVSEHVERILALVTRSFVPGTALVKFGGGDWNDSLQPVSKELAQRLISSWTVQMSYQAVDEYREVHARSGSTDRARELSGLADNILADFHRHLVKDGVVAGYGLVGPDQTIDVLLHPRDTTTGVHYSLLPMNRGVISRVFSPQQAQQHLDTIEQHLKGPDGARLMDRPLRYRGGPQTLFQRAESSTYFGREIGLMYVHEHLRYAEAQARTGRPDAFLKALRQAIPVDYRQVVPQGELRQANCYYSSSDVAFQSRYEADERYDEVVAGEVPLQGGWRVYSSGPGIYVALTVSRLLGLRIEYGHVILDPVLARSLDGLQASLRFRGRRVTFTYRVDGAGFGPRKVVINGQDVPFDREENRYREGGAAFELERFMALLGDEENRVELWI